MYFAGMNLLPRSYFVATGGNNSKMTVSASATTFTTDNPNLTVGGIGTADNDVNALVSMGMIPGGYTVNHYLTDTDAFYITTDVPNGMKHMERAPLTTKMEGDFDTGNVRYKARERYVFGVSDPRGIYASPGA